MSWLRASVALSLVLLAAPGCGGDKCVKQGARQDCPDGYVGYGRRKPNRNKDWLPVFGLVDLSLWAADGSYDDGKTCELACVPEALGQPEELGTCDAFQPCGGDVLGDWRWEPYACPYEVPVDLTSSCPDAVQSLAVTNDGTLSFEEDGTVRFTATQLDSTDTVHLPATCLDSLGTCEELAGVGDGCVGDPARGCACSGARTGQSANWEGTWAKFGTGLEIERNGQTFQVDYCSDGGQLVLDWEPVSGTEVRVRELLFAWEN